MYFFFGNIGSKIDSMNSGVHKEAKFKISSENSKNYKCDLLLVDK